MNNKSLLAKSALSAAILTIISTAHAQQSPENIEEEVVVTGIRQALSKALDQKRSANSLVDVINAEDIGKLPDQNLAEVLENVPGVQITREAGVGNGVQIRGIDDNRTSINGVTTVGSGNERGGIDFEDVSAAIIAGVEVIKSPEAKTVEGSAGGTINLRTIRPLDLTEMLGSVRIQGEDSSLTTDGVTPRISGSWGDNWTTDSGEFGVVISASYSEQDVSSFRPRADRDNLITSDGGAEAAQSFDFLPIQFLVQDYDNFEYETKNLSGSFEFAPNDNVKFYFDAVINDQERLQESTRIQASGVSSLRNFSVPDEFETINFGSLDGENGSQNLGSIEAALRGVIPVNLDADDDDPNLRMSTDTSSRVTTSEIFRLGGDWNTGNWSGRVEISTTRSESKTPVFDATLNFINPNAPLDAGGGNDNSTPFEYDLSGGSLAFGVAYGTANAPTREDLLQAENYVLRDVNQQQDINENGDDAFVLDFSYDVDAAGFTSIDFGYRYNETTSLSDEVRSNVGLRDMVASPWANEFEEVLSVGPNNFGDADGRSLFVRDFLVINPELVNSDPGYVVDILRGPLDEVNANITAYNEANGFEPNDDDYIGQVSIDTPTSSTAAFFDISEETNALYAQANFEAGIFRGNFGLRYLETDVTSIGNRVTNDQVVVTTSTSSYDFVLPRINVVANVTDDIIVRAAWSEDIFRPDFSDLSPSFSFDTSPNADVDLGNTQLVPLEVTSFELGAEWYFAPSAVVSLGYFSKKRDGAFVDVEESAFEDPVTGFRDLTDPCEGGGIFNPIADVNVFGPDGGTGLCVGTSQKVNGSGEQTQDGFEFAFQYDVSGFEDSLGWASGFGVLANYTIQDFEGGDDFLEPTSRAQQVFEALGSTDITYRQIPADISETAYNFTLYYEKYGLSARMRYTWREAYRSEDFGSTTSNPWGFPVVQEDRGQLNASVSYDVNDNLNIGFEVVNLTESEVEQSCVNEGALLCFQGLTDRRITFGGSYRF